MTLQFLPPTHRPRLAPVASDVDVAVIGAGAAGIAAARTCLSLGLSCAVLEARPRVGGRAVTVRIGAHPVDLGAHWMHAGTLNPLVRLGLERGEPLRRASTANHLVQRGRFADGAERRRYGEAFDKADRAIAASHRADIDPSIRAVLPPLGPAGKRIAATLALISGRPLGEVSARDFPSDEFGDNWFVRGGYGAFLSRLADGLPVALGCPVSGVDWSSDAVVVHAGDGHLRARTAIVTAPATVLAAGTIRFTPALPADLSATIGRFLPGTYEHLILHWPDAPFRASDRLARLESRRGSLGMMTRLDGSPLHYVEFDHETVAAHGGRKPPLAALVRRRLAEQFGREAVRGLQVRGLTDWNGDPWSRGAWAVVAPGNVGDRATLSRPVGDRLWFAGEAGSARLWGTVGGAWEEGERAARSVAAQLGGPEPEGRFTNPGRDTMALPTG